MRKRVKGSPNRELYRLRVEALSLLEAQSEQGHIDLYYGDESKQSRNALHVRKAMFPMAGSLREKKLVCL